MATVEGKVVKVGDYVGFKSDVEQSGKIIKIEGNMLLLSNRNGFEGAYIGGQPMCWQTADRCWLN